MPLFGYHGVSHWARVLENGVRLAESTGADARVVELFALFHDSQRINESSDPGHGSRGAKLARHMRDEGWDALTALSDDEFEMMCDACDRHTDGTTDGPVTVQTCWDADRLDLFRVGMYPDTRYLCTAAAKNYDTIAWACGRAAERQVPDFVYSRWGVTGGRFN
ncbi:MAG: HD domain-containing protein [Phycisphaera sp.]|nr:HD domain-containing protein [Phycisphaera sp.]